MPSKKALLTSAITVLTTVLITLIAGNSLQVAADQAHAEVVSEFKDKVVTVYLAGSPEGTGYALINAEIINIGGRQMLVGTGADSGNEDDWTQGIRIGLAWDAVETYFAMTEDEYDAKVRQNSM